MTAPRPNLPSDVLRALARGDKIGAIKLVRELTGYGLREAKDIAEGRRSYQGPQSPPHGQLPAPPHGQLPAWPHQSADPGHFDAGTGLAPGEQPSVSVNSALVGWLAALVAAGLLLYLYAR
jgi:Ribosomal protein L7/L12 C-terminal domain